MLITGGKIHVMFTDSDVEPSLARKLDLIECFFATHDIPEPVAVAFKHDNAYCEICKDFSRVKLEEQIEYVKGISNMICRGVADE